MQLCRLPSAQNSLPATYKLIGDLTGDSKQTEGRNTDPAGSFHAHLLEICGGVAVSIYPSRNVVALR
ncbi:MAG: hypothetical protein RR131_08080 [Anaerovorax sp.]